MGKYEPIDTWEKSKSFSKEINVNDLIVEELEKVKAEIEKLDSTDIGSLFDFDAHHGAEDMKFNVTRIIEKHISELKGSE